MKKIAIAQDTKIQGLGILRQGEKYKVDHFNGRFVYVEWKPGIIIRLARKRDCVVLY